MQESTILGLAGLLVGAFSVGASLWWNYATRASLHREFLYERQIEMYRELTNSVTRVVWPLINSKNAKELRRKIEKAERDLLAPFYKALPIMPKDVGAFG